MRARGSAVGDDDFALGDHLLQRVAEVRHCREYGGEELYEADLPLGTVVVVLYVVVAHVVVETAHVVIEEHVIVEARHYFLAHVTAASHTCLLAAAERRRTSLAALVAPVDDVVLYFGGEHHEIGAEAPHSDHEVPVLLGTRLRIKQLLLIHHVELDVLPSVPEEGVDQHAQLLPAPLALHKRGGELLVETRGVGLLEARLEDRAQDAGGTEPVHAAHWRDRTIVEGLPGLASVGKRAYAQPPEVVPGKALARDLAGLVERVLVGLDDAAREPADLADHEVCLVQVIPELGRSEAHLPDLLATFAGEVAVESIQHLVHAQELVVVDQLLEGCQRICRVDNGPVAYPVAVSLGGDEDVPAVLHASRPGDARVEWEAQIFRFHALREGAEPHETVDDELVLPLEGPIQVVERLEFPRVARIDAYLRAGDLRYAPVQREVQDQSDVDGTLALGSVVVDPAGEDGRDTALAIPLSGLLCREAVVDEARHHVVAVLEQGDAALGPQIGLQPLEQQGPRRITAPIDQDGGRRHAEQPRHVQDEVAQWVGGIAPILIHPAHIDAVDTEAELMGLLLSLADGYDRLHAPEGECVTDQFGRLLHGGASALEIAAQIRP